MKDRYDVIKDDGTSTIYTKKAIDKKFQLTGAVLLPFSGIYYYKIRLIDVQHGYIHFGLLSDLNELEPSSYSSQNCINYFGGNGSINDKSNGVYVGKPLKNNDMMIVLINTDLKRIFFIMSGKVIGEADFKTIQKNKGYVPYM